MKDLVNVPTQKYDNIYNIIGRGGGNGDNYHEASSSPIYPSDIASLLPSSSPDASTFLMKNELKQFLKTQLDR